MQRSGLRVRLCTMLEARQRNELQEALISTWLTCLAPRCGGAAPWWTSLLLPESPRRGALAAPWWTSLLLLACRGAVGAIRHGACVPLGQWQWRTTAAYRVGKSHASDGSYHIH